VYAADIAADHPDLLALIMAGTGASLTFREFEDAADRFAQLLRAHGLRRGDRVAFFMPNSLELMEVQGGAERTGLYYTLINSQLQAQEAAYIVNDCSARVVVTSSALVEVASQLPEICPRVERWLMVDPPDGLDTFESYGDAVAAHPAEPVQNEQRGLPLLYSSGTTGRPKGILRPLIDSGPRDATGALAVAPRVYRFRPGMVFLQPAPMYHGGPHSALSAALRIGGTSVIVERFKPEPFLEFVQRYRVTHTVVVPTHLARMLQLSPEVRESYDVSSLEAVVHGAGPCPPIVKRRSIEWLGPIIHEYYGTSEAIGATSANSEEWLERPGTVGRPVFGEPAILDEDGNELPPRQIGLIWFRGATNFEYLGDAEKTQKDRRESGNMSTTGDIGYLDEDGFLYVTDRIDFTIVAGGVNIYPQEIEDVLLEHPKVADVAVVGVPHPDLGEEVKAVVEPAPGVVRTSELEQELIAFARERLARFKVPRSVDFVDALPRTEGGKVVKREIRDPFWKTAESAERS
jgi:acyl-coenzyme A synthetase/AMP-(fatty) acid ligase